MLFRSQSTTGTEEAKDFKVVVTIDALDPNQDELRPGLSATAKITTAHKPDALTIPIQALVQRDPAAEKTLFDNGGKPATASAAATPSKVKPVTSQGVYVIATNAKGKMAVHFVPVTTGITGSTDIEVLSGLKEGDKIVTGRYKVLRTLASGTKVKEDNSAEVATTDS